MINIPNKCSESYENIFVNNKNFDFEGLAEKKLGDVESNL
jgi:hypothetical protein